MCCFSLLASKTAPTIAEMNKIDETSNGTTYLENKRVPKFSTKPTSLLTMVVVKVIPSFNAAKITRRSAPPAITAVKEIG